MSTYKNGEQRHFEFASYSAFQKFLVTDDHPSGTPHGPSYIPAVVFAEAPKCSARDYLEALEKRSKFLAPFSDCSAQKQQMIHDGKIAAARDSIQQPDYNGGVLSMIPIYFVAVLCRRSMCRWIFAAHYLELLIMKLSLSVRIVEATCKTKLSVPFEELVAIAKETGYNAVCLRASAGGVDTSKARLVEMRRCVEDAGLLISMVTADFNVPLNNDQGPNSLRNISPSLDVAEIVGCTLIRVCLKTPDDIPFARQAAQLAAQRGVRLAHQCHTSSLFEQVEPMLKVVEKIGQPNFGLIYEPANLLLNGQSYGLDSLQKLRPYLMNVYVQNHRLNVAGSEELPTFCRGNVRFDHLDPWTPGGVDFPSVTTALKQIGYNGTFTIHQAQGIQSANDARTFARRCAEYFRPLLRAEAADV